MKKYLTPALWIIAFQTIAAAIGAVTRGNMGWYDTLAKSTLNPPDIAFPIVWTTLYIMLALAGWLMWKERNNTAAKPAFILYWAQMALNWAWSFVFFEFQLVAIGFFWIIALNLTMLAFIIRAWSINRIAACLVAPTLAWGSFAAYLNYMIWILN